jgi:hypothetical protein
MELTANENEESKMTELMDRPGTGLPVAHQAVPEHTVSTSGSAGARRSTPRSPMFSGKEKAVVLGLTAVWTAYLWLHIGGAIALFGVPFVDQVGT